MEQYANIFLRFVARAKQIPEPEAARLIDDCIRQAAVDFRVSNAVIQKELYDESFFQSCLAGKCSSQTLEDCSKSCHCVVYGDSCIPRRLPKFATINRDPDKYIATLSTAELEELTNQASYLYHNYDGGGLTDNSYDALEWHLKKRMKARQRRYGKIGAPPVERIRTSLPYPMPSLNKVKPGTRQLRDFIQNIPTKLAVSYKLDGVSGMVIYTRGQVSAIYVRGDGEIGGDVSYLKDYITFPTLQEGQDDLVVRGEFILPRAVWRNKYHDLYANARSFVSAQLNQGFISTYLPDIDFVAYDIIQVGDGERLPPPSQRYRLLELHHFKIVPYQLFPRLVLTYDLIAHYTESRAASSYDIDGLVLRYDIPSLVQRELSVPHNDVAFKMLLEEQIRETQVLDVEWRISRYGKYIPIVIYEAVYINGIRIHRATGHNAAHIRDWSMGPGTKIKVARVGDAIPQIQDVIVDEAIDPIFPSFDYMWHWERSHIMLDQIDTNRDVQIKRLYHFFSTIQVRGFGEKTAEKVWEAGFRQVRDVTNLTVAELTKVKGYGIKRATTLISGIHDRLQHTPLDRFIEASTTLNIGIGRKIIKSLTSAFPDILLVDRTSAEIEELLRSKKVKGIGPKRIQNIALNIPRFRAFLFDLNAEDIKIAIAHQRRRMQQLKQTGFNQLIHGQTIVLTGFMNRTNYDLEDYIYDHQGQFSSTVTSGTTAVIAASIGTITGKMETARRLEVPIYTVPEFEHRFHIKYDGP